MRGLRDRALGRGRTVRASRSRSLTHLAVGHVQVDRTGRVPSASTNVSVLSACQSPMLNVLVTMRAPGLSCLVRIGLRRRFDADSRKVVTTVALLTSVFSASCSLNLTRCLTPASWRWPWLPAIRTGSMSTPSPRAPYFLAAQIGMRPSPHPRSTTKSFLVTLARLSIRSTTSCGVGT